MEPYVFCPYNTQHRVPLSRIQRHLIKCEQVYPPLSICPYNATHRYTKDKIKAHVADCPAKEQFLLEQKPDKTNAMITTPHPMPHKECEYINDPEYESWD